MRNNNNNNNAELRSEHKSSKPEVQQRNARPQYDTQFEQHDGAVVVILFGNPACGRGMDTPPVALQLLVVGINGGIRESLELFLFSKQIHNSLHTLL